MKYYKQKHGDIIIRTSQMYDFDGNVDSNEWFDRWFPANGWESLAYHVNGHLDLNRYEEISESDVMLELL